MRTKKVFNSISEAITSIKSNFFHTFLSVLGIIIGVGALVSILSLIDGMEQYAHEQISKTTSIEAVIIQSDAYTTIDGVKVKKDSLKVINYSAFQDLKKNISVEGARVYIQSAKSGRYIIEANTKKVGLLNYVNAELRPDTEMVLGRWLSQKDLIDGDKNIVINEKLYNKLGNKQSILDQTILFEQDTFNVIGVIKDESKSSSAYVPYTLLHENELLTKTPTTVALAETVETVPELKKQVSSWLDSYFGDAKSNFIISTNDSRVEQANKGFLLFRVIMGLIVGISVVVGGIGVMNVLLISVTERTKEIGIRKAAGAKKSDIVLQFILESVTISAFGSFLGVIFGVLFTIIAIPIIKSLIEAPFQAAFTLNTLIIISITSVVIGVVFGTYPAIKASKLDPVDAIRHE